MIRGYKLTTCIAGLSCFLFFGVSARAGTTQLITNGGFETGDFTGWSTFDQAGGSGSFFVLSGTTEPLSGMPTVGPASGTFYASSDQTGPGAHALIQSFTVPTLATSVILSFDMFANNWAGVTACPGPLDYTIVPNECGRVDLLTGSAGAFDTGADDLKNFYMGSDTGTNPNPYTHYSFDITSLVSGGGTFQIRFAEADNQLFYNLGVDDVSIVATMASTPEPSTVFLLGAGMAFLVLFRRFARIL
jgi:hypothetical protein